MKGVMHLVSDEEIKVLSDYMAKLKPRSRAKFSPGAS
jgi:cytochrome c553